MPPGIRATLEFDTPDICPIVELSAAAGTTIDSVSTNVCPPDCAESVTEFTIDNEGGVQADVRRVFSSGSIDRYRITHEEGATCPCESLGQMGCPIARYVARDGTLTIEFHVADYDRLRAIISELRDRYPGVDIKRFVRSPAEEHARDPVSVDRSKLTHRQREILETAYQMGYFDRPRQSNATEIAAALDINPSTFREHLAAAESKVLDDLL